MAVADERRSITVSLADVGCDVPGTVTVDVERTPSGLVVDRHGESFVVEHDGGQYALTGVVGYDELPDCVPGWLAAVAARFGIEEVTLGR